MVKEDLKKINKENLNFLCRVILGYLTKTYKLYEWKFESYPMTKYFTGRIGDFRYKRDVSLSINQEENELLCNIGWSSGPLENTTGSFTKQKFPMQYNMSQKELEKLAQAIFEWINKKIRFGY